MKKLANIIGVGIDIAKEKMDIVIRTTELEQYFTVTNTESGIRKLEKQIQKYKGKIVMESTGRYHLLVAIMLSELGYDVRVINPLQAKKYVTASIRKNKTDKTDAKILAEMAVIEKDLPKTFHRTREDMEIHHKISLIATLEEQIQIFTGTLREYQEAKAVLGKTLSQAEISLLNILKQIVKEKTRLEGEVDEFFREQSRTSELQSILTSIPGISPYACNLILHFFDIQYTHPKQWVTFVGLDVSQRQSGQWKGKGKLSKRGNGYVRKRLFACAWGAMMNSEQFKAYYDELRKSRTYKETLIIIARKILRIACSLIQSKKIYSPDYMLSA